MKLRTGMICAVLLVCGLQLYGQQADSGTYTLFDAPGAGGGGNQGTFPFAISPNGAITGYYLDANYTYHGFVRDHQDGSITTFDVPGAGNGPFQGTIARDINPKGAITGYYCDANLVCPGFVRDRDGTITTFDAPGDVHGTKPSSINPKGVITGYYQDVNRVVHGFVRDPDGTITTFEAPGAGTRLFQGTYGVGINPRGTVSGCYTDANYVGHGFVRDPDGTITTFDVPNGKDVGRHCAGYSFPGSGTAINNEGAVTGTYFQPILGNPFGGNYRGFLMNTDGTFTTFDAATYLPCCIWTFGIAINPDGAIVGYQNDGYSINHGFLRTPDGTVTTLDAPGAGTGQNQGTIADGINPDGRITGWWIDAGNVRHGFLWTGTP